MRSGCGGFSGNFLAMATSTCADECRQVTPRAEGGNLTTLKKGTKKAPTSRSEPVRELFSAPYRPTEQSSGPGRSHTKRTCSGVETEFVRRARHPFGTEERTAQNNPNCSSIRALKLSST